MTKLKDKIIKWAVRKSPWILHFNSGSCNGCDIEILATLTPKYDLERVGVLLKGTPRHADILVVSGAVSKQQAGRLLNIYNQMPNPKFIVAVGACACSGGVSQGCYGVLNGVDKLLPVSAYIPGCPPRPEAIIDGVAKLLSTLENDYSSKKHTSKDIKEQEEIIVE